MKRLASNEAASWPFDFDHWSRMAREDPERFEAMRSQAISDAIESAPESMRRRLEGLQWQIDVMRSLSSSPLSACVRISNLMWETVLGDRGLLQTLEGRVDRTPSASILPMPRKPRA